MRGGVSKSPAQEGKAWLCNLNFSIYSCVGMPPCSGAFLSKCGCSSQNVFIFLFKSKSIFTRIHNDPSVISKIFFSVKYYLSTTFSSKTHFLATRNIFSFLCLSSTLLYPGRVSGGSLFQGWENFYRVKTCNSQEYTTSEIFSSKQNHRM